MQQDKDTAIRYHQRAADVRSIAATMSDKKYKEILMGVADDYEMARQLEIADEVDRKLATEGKPRNSK